MIIFAEFYYGDRNIIMGNSIYLTLCKIAFCQHFSCLILLATFFKVVPYQKENLETASFLLYSFLFSTPGRHYVKMVNDIIDICSVKCCARTSSFVFEKKQVFLKLTIFFILRNNDILARVVTFSESTSKIKVVLQKTLFLILIISAVI